jgi:hypothetical protein
MDTTALEKYAQNLAKIVKSWWKFAHVASGIQHKYHGSIQEV